MDRARGASHDHRSVDDDRDTHDVVVGIPTHAPRLEARVRIEVDEDAVVGSVPVNVVPRTGFEPVLLA